MSIKASIRRLAKAYFNHKILYPRTEADFLPITHRSGGYAHPKLKQFDDLDFIVHKGEMIRLKLESISLYFTQKKLTTPALIESTTKFLGRFIGQGIDIKNDKKEEAELIAKTFLDTLSEYGINREELISRDKREVFIVKTKKSREIKPKKSRFSIFKSFDLINIKIDMFLKEFKNYRKMTISNLTAKIKQETSKAEDDIEIVNHETKDDSALVSNQKRSF